MIENVLYIVLSLNGANIKADYTLGAERKSIVVSNKKNAVLTRCNTIYDIIEANKTGKSKQLARAVRDLTGNFVTPVQELFTKAGHINFIVDKPLVRCAFDLLEANDKPLYLSHKITYSAFGYRAKNPSLVPKGGYFVADASTDPEDGFKTAGKLFPGSRWEPMENSSLEEISRGGSYNILAISGHGDLDNKNSGSIGINEEELDSDTMENIDVALAYLDSCQMGANWDFVETFHTEKNSTFMVAPITSNDAGDSSTLTVVWFFENLKKSNDVADALFKTRVRLYNHYKKAGLDPVTIINKAFCFRLYEFRR